MNAQFNPYDYEAMVKSIISFNCDAGYSKSELLEILPLIKAKIVRLRRGEVIAPQGALSKLMALVVSGSLKMRINLGNGRRGCLMRTIRTGEFAGHSLIFQPDSTYPCDTYAFPESTVITLDLAALRAWMKESNSRPFFNLVAVQLCRSIAVAWQHSFAISHRTLVDRLLFYLNVRSIENGNSDIFIPGTMTELAEYLVCDRASLCRAVSDLCDKGIIARKGRNHISLLKPNPIYIPMKELSVIPKCTSPIPVLRKKK